MALSSDASLLAIGGPYDNDKDGAAWVFERTAGGEWNQGDKVVGSGSIGEQLQGQSIAMSGDGSTLAVGAPGDNSSIGATWVFTRDAGLGWLQQGDKLVGTGSIGAAAQGSAVALSEDGSTLAVGAPDDDSLAGTGATWVFVRSVGGEWLQQGEKLVGTGGVGAFQGFSVDLSGDGTTLAVGGDADSNYIGAAWVFTSSGGEWSQQGSKLVGSGVTTDSYSYQGCSLALAADGDTLAVGGFGDGDYVGSAWTYTRSTGEWSQQGERLVGAGVVLGQDAASVRTVHVALSADGSVLAVGRTDSNISPDGQSSAAGVLVFQRSAAEWVQQGSVLTGSLASGTFTGSVFHVVALSARGNTLALGFSESGGEDVGA